MPPMRMHKSGGKKAFKYIVLVNTNVWPLLFIKFDIFDTILYYRLLA